MGQVHFEKVRAEHQKQPDVPIGALLKKLKIHPNKYYGSHAYKTWRKSEAKAKAAPVATSRIKKPRKKRAAESSASILPQVAPSQVMLIIGSPEQIRAVMQ